MFDTSKMMGADDGMIFSLLDCCQLVDIFDRKLSAPFHLVAHQRVRSGAMMMMAAHSIRRRRYHRFVNIYEVKKIKTSSCSSSCVSVAIQRCHFAHPQFIVVGVFHPQMLCNEVERR
jgi:hypothetical protein